MESTDLVIVGGGPAGLSAATGYRDARGTGSVLLIGDESVHPYARPPLSKDFLRGECAEDTLPLQPSARYGEQAVTVRLSRRVESLDPATRMVTLDDGEQVHYGNCVLTTGAVPTVLPVPGQTTSRSAPCGHWRVRRHCGWWRRHPGLSLAG